LQALRDGRARVCVATDVAARGIDLPNLDLVIHSDLPNDAEVMQHRSGRTGRAGRKGVSVLLVPPARRRRAELLLNLAGIDAIWGKAPGADEIRKLDQERMLKDKLFAEANTDEDLVLARALLAERAPEDIAAALARLYRARLPSPEDILDPDQGGRSRDDRGPRKEARPARGDERDTRPPSKKPSPRNGMAEGSVWFRAGIGKRKNAEARWLLPMICRRGGIDKQDIGAIRIHDTTTEFEISERVADSFAAKIKRPDKEDNIRIELLGDTPANPSSPKPWDGPKHKSKEDSRSDRRPDRARDDRPREGQRPKPYAKPHREDGSRSDRGQDPKKKKQHQDWTGNAEPARYATASAEKPQFAKKSKKKHRGQ
jgi:ATP-dependent RNA helicase DeaD